MDNINFEIVKGRHSVRNFLDRPITGHIKEALEATIANENRASSLAMQLVTDETEAFGRSFFAHYGKFSGVANYVALIGPKDASEALGFHGEAVVLEAQRLGLNTCWVGLSYNKNHVGCDIPTGMKLHALIAVGYGVNQGVERKLRPLEKLAPDVASAPEWFAKAMEWVVVAPSAINQQKYRFRYIDDHTVKVAKGFGPYSAMDLGIAKRHFILGARPRQITFVK